MFSERLIEDPKQQAYLKDETKYLVEEALTIAMEIIMGKSVEEWTADDIQKLEPHRSPGFQGKPLIQSRRNGKKIVEYSDSVRLLSDYFSSGKYAQDYKNKIVNEQKENDEFVDKKFRSEFDKQCEEERNLLNILRETRNTDAVHVVEAANMGDIYSWIKQLMKYLDCFSGYRMQVLSKYDFQYGKKEDQERLDDCYTKASELKEQCFSSKENYKEFRFGKNTYKVAKDDKDDFELLIPDMARSWERGISYLKKERAGNAFHELLEAYFEDYDMVIDFDEKYDEFIRTENKSIRESLLYMSILYLLYPKLAGIYWKGVMYSESSFASVVLQVLTRHPNVFSFEEKKKTLLYRINNLQEWNETSEKQKGIGIDLVGVCQQHILSNYYNGQGDLEGAEYAKKFELRVLECKNIDYVDKHYDEIIEDILILTKHMKGRVTYMLPIPDKDIKDGRATFKVFRKPDEFREYFNRFIHEASNMDEIAEFVHCVWDDNNFKWFMENEDVFTGRVS